MWVKNSQELLSCQTEGILGKLKSQYTVAIMHKDAHPCIFYSLSVIHLFSISMQFIQTYQERPNNPNMLCLFNCHFQLEATLPTDSLLTAAQRTDQNLLPKNRQLQLLLLVTVLLVSGMSQFMPALWLMDGPRLLSSASVERVYPIIAVQSWRKYSNREEHHKIYTL